MAAARRPRRARKDRRPEPRARRARQAPDAAPLARRVRRALLHPRRLGPRVAGRGGARSPAGRLRHPPRRRTRAHLHRRPGRARRTSSTARGTRRSSAGCRARTRCASAGRGSRAAPTTRGTSRRSGRRSPTASRRLGRRTSSTSTRSSGTKGTPTRGRDSPGGRRRAAGLNWRQLGRASRATVPHCHSEDEEVFVILEGDGTLELWPSPLGVAQRRGARGHPGARGHVVARPPSTRVVALLPRRRRTA